MRFAENNESYFSMEMWKKEIGKKLKKKLDWRWEKEKFVFK